MARKQRSSEGESIPLAPEVSAPPVVMQYESPPLPTLHGYGMTQAFTRGDKWVVYRCSTSGDLEMLTPKGKAGVIVGESKPSAAGRLTQAMREAYT